MRMLFATIILIVSFSLAAQVNNSILEGDEYTELINLMSDCSGTWEFFAMADDATGNSASAKQMRERRNGAALVAKYLLTLEYRKKTGKKKVLKEFANYVASRSEPMITALLAFTEREDFDLIKVELEKCRGALEIQDKFIQLIRDEVYRN